MANKYWKDKEEILAHQWVTAVKTNDLRKQAYLYKKLHAPVQRLINGICQRFYQVPVQDYQELLNDCTQKVFLKLDRLDDRGSAFSYIGTITKNFYYQELVAHTLVENSKTVKLEYSDDNDFDNGIEYLNPIELSPEDVQYIHKYLLDLIERKQLGREKTIYSVNTGGQKKIRNLSKQIQALNLCIEYLLKYNDFNDKSVTQYVRFAMGVDSIYTAYLFQCLFGVGIGREKENYADVDNRYYYLTDDICPIDESNHMTQRARAKKNHSGYEDFRF